MSLLFYSHFETLVYTCTSPSRQHRFLLANIDSNVGTSTHSRQLNPTTKGKETSHSQVPILVHIPPLYLEQVCLLIGMISFFQSIIHVVGVTGVNSTNDNGARAMYKY
jgi:hypothetical protein